MKPTRFKFTALIPLLLAVALCILGATPDTANAQGLDRWLGPTSWWDWSDYRFIAKYRVMFPKLQSGTLSRGSVEHDLMARDPGAGRDASGGYNMEPNPKPFTEGWFQLQVDRLGLRLISEEDRIFRGILGATLTLPSLVRDFDAPDLTVVENQMRVSELDMSATRLGIDLDIIRYPMFRFGFNFDYALNGIEFNDSKFAWLDPYVVSSDPVGTVPRKKYWAYLTRNYGDLISSEPITVGIQATAIPVRIKEAPIIVCARARVPMPFMKEVFKLQNPANVTDWEVSVGLRPSIWDSSPYKFATFSLGVEAGFRSVYIDADLQNRSQTPVDRYPSATNVKAKFSGAFIQVGIYY